MCNNTFAGLYSARSLHTPSFHRNDFSTCIHFLNMMVMLDNSMMHSIKSIYGIFHRVPSKLLVSSTIQFFHVSLHFTTYIKVNVTILIGLYTESPGPPRNLTVSSVTNTSALLSWSPPDDDGGRPLSEIFYTVQTHGNICSS